jgi:histidyl-tRNA synthetase
MKLNTEPYKGTRDFYPEDMFIQNYIFSTMRKTVEGFGYEEYNASILEETALYKAKSGEEIVNEQTYSFTDRGGRDVTLRPEMTPTIARMVAKKQRELSFPVRWYSIPNMFRYERPQRGRLREHWQLNVDMFGSDSHEADAEIIRLAWTIMRAFGAKESDFIIRLNNRKVLTHFFKKILKLDDEKSHRASKLLDKKDKLPKETFESEAKELLGDEYKPFMVFVKVRSLDELEIITGKTEGTEELRKILETLEKDGVLNVKFDPTLVRGFDYYTGTVFEIYDTDKANPRALFGGGRYDNLVDMFGTEKVTGVGFGMGDVTIRDYLETRNLLPVYNSKTDIYLCTMSEEAIEYAKIVADALRFTDVNVAIDFTGRKVPAQIKTAEKHSIPYIICIGEAEIGQKTLKIKDLETHEEHELDISKIAEFIKQKRV